MPDISIHHSKEEGEGDDEVYAWVCFFVGWNGVFIYYLLENSREFIQLEVSWRVKRRCRYSFDLQIVLSS